MRNFGSCKCGNISAFGSDPPPACDPCEKCGTVPGGRDPIPHDFSITKVETDEGLRVLTRCIRCTKRKYTQEDKNSTPIGIAKLKDENAKLRTALMELEERLHSSELEAMTGWNLLEEANKKMAGMVCGACEGSGEVNGEEWKLVPCPVCRPTATRPQGEP